jgi:hypothetical protein
LAGIIDNGKLVEKVRSFQINYHNIFHKRVGKAGLFVKAIVSFFTDRRQGHQHGRGDVDGLYLPDHPGVDFVNIYIGLNVLRQIQIPLQTHLYVYRNLYFTLAFFGCNLQPKTDSSNRFQIKPTVTADFPKMQEVKEGAEFVLSAKIDGSPPPTAIWDRFYKAPFSAENFLN